MKILFALILAQLPLLADYQLISEESIQTQIEDSALQVQTAAQKIIDTPPDQQTFENTLQAWYDISEEICATSASLDKQLSEKAVEEYQRFTQSLYQHCPELHCPLFSYAKKALAEDTLKTVFQQELAHLVGIQCEQYRELMSPEDQEFLTALIALNGEIENPRRVRSRAIVSTDRHVSYNMRGIKALHNQIILCGEISGSVGADTQGNASADISISGQSDDGRFSGRITGEINRDRDGNVTGSIGARGTLEFNRS